MMRHPLICSLANLSVALVADIPNLAFGAVFDQSRYGYSANLPEGWRQIPPKILADYSDTVNRVSGGKIRQQYQDGYQRDFNGKWLIHPYILVQVQETGRVPEGQLRNLKPVRRGIEKGLGQAADGLGDVLSQAALGETLFDSTNKCLWMQFSANVAGVGPIKAVSCGFLTEKGVIYFHCYSKAAEFEELLPAFQRAMSSVGITETWRYKPHLGDQVGFDFGTVFRRTLYGALIGGVAGAIVWSVKKFQANRTSSGPRPPPLPPSG
jgi:hypothetical protein